MNKDRKKRFLIMILAIVMCVALFYVFMNLDTWLSPDSPDDGVGVGEIYDEMRAIYIDGDKYLPKNKLSTMLVMGFDKTGVIESSGSYNNNVQTDFLALVIFDGIEKKYTVLSINRDTMTSVDVYGATGTKISSSVMQIALAHTYGDGLTLSCENTVKAVSKLLYGIRIDNYVALNMNAISQINDHFDGVTVTLPRDYTELNPAYVKGAVVTLKNEDALSFIRARGEMNEPTNIARMERQRLYMNAFIDKIKEKKPSAESLADLYDELDDYMITDFDLTALRSMMNNVMSYSNGGIISPDGEAKAGTKFMEFYVDKEKLGELIAGLAYKKASE